MKFGGAFGDKKNKIRKTIYKVSIRHHRVANENLSMQRGVQMLVFSLTLIIVIQERCVRSYKLIAQSERNVVLLRTTTTTGFDFKHKRETI